MAGGGTAGHVIPGLAVLEQWRRVVPDAELFFIGGAGGFEEQLTRAAGVELVKLPATPFAREGLPGKLRAGWNTARAALAARSLMRHRQPHLVLGFGGYPSAPALAAARWFGAATAIHEANVEPGLGNRLSARLVDRIFLGWEQTAVRFPAGKCLVVGNPLPSSRLPHDSEQFGGSNDKRTRVLVVGGSEGSPHLNSESPRLLGEALRRSRGFEVRHLCGWGDQAAVSRDYAAQGVPAKVESFVDNLADLYRCSDFVISTAGAITLAELSAWGLPALLAPLQGAAGRHQHANAAAYAERTGALLDWSVESVLELLQTSRGKPSMSQANVAEQIAAACLEMISAETGA